MCRQRARCTAELMAQEDGGDFTAVFTGCNTAHSLSYMSADIVTRTLYYGDIGLIVQSVGALF